MILDYRQLINVVINDNCKKIREEKYKNVETLSSSWFNVAIPLIKRNGKM